MNSEGDIRQLDQFQKGEKVVKLTDEQAAMLIKVSKEERQAAFKKMWIQQLKGHR